MKLHGTTVALAITAGLLGAGHLGLTPLLYPDWTIDSLWFVGTGLAMLAVAGANGLGIGVGARRAGLVLMNLTMTAFFAAAWSVLPEPQVVIGGVLFAGLTVTAALSGVLAPEQGKQNAG